MDDQVAVAVGRTRECLPGLAQQRGRIVPSPAMTVVEQVVRRLGEQVEQHFSAGVWLAGRIAVKAADGSTQLRSGRGENEVGPHAPARAQAFLALRDFGLTLGGGASRGSSGRHMAQKSAPKAVSSMLRRTVRPPPPRFFASRTSGWTSSTW